MIDFEINLDSVKYPVYVGSNLLNSIDSYVRLISSKGNVVILIDEHVAQLKRDELLVLREKFHYHVYIVSGGKNNKSFYSALKIFEFLDLNNISRDSTVIAVGGGVIGDLGGFVASCWYRGVSLIHIPTTLLSAVDSCVGGKTAINFRSTVNAVGTYHHPKAIIIDLDLIKSLPPREISSGFGEIIKYACIGSTEIKDILEAGSFESSGELAKLIVLSLKEKEKFVRGDIGEESRRLFLNFGHTIGHAIEFSTIFNGEESLRHGEGVGLGMIAIFKVCEKLGHLAQKDIVWLKNIMSKYKLPISFDASALGIDRDHLVERVVDLCFKDKKRVMDELRLILINTDFIPFIYKTNDRSLIKCGVLEVII